MVEVSDITLMVGIMKENGASIGTMAMGYCFGLMSGSILVAIKLAVAKGTGSLYGLMVGHTGVPGTEESSMDEASMSTTIKSSRKEFGSMAN
jgi:hypothetical protein